MRDKPMPSPYTTWEHIENRQDIGDTYRLKVSGGWIYRIRELSLTHGTETVSVVFVPQVKFGERE